MEHSLSKEQKPTIHWYAPLSMCMLYGIGTTAAVAHHAFYESLAGTPVENQLTYTRYATALALIAKISFVWVVVVAYRQRVWYACRRELLKISSLDSLFGMTEDFALLFNREIFVQTKLCAALALFAWLIPAATLLSPSSLLSESKTYAHSTVCNVASLDFLKEDQISVTRSMTGPFPGYQLSFISEFNGRTIYLSPSKVARKITSKSALSGAIVEGQSYCEYTNCTYTIPLTVPSYKCSSFQLSDIPENSPVNISDILPTGSLAYIAKLESNCAPKDGTFYCEPALWIGYSSDSLEQHLFRCEHYVSELEILVSKTYESITTTVRKSSLIGPLLMGDGSYFRSPMHPTDTAYRAFIGMHALGELTRHYLLGSVELQSSGTNSAPITLSDISQTTLIDQFNSMPVPNLPQKVEEFYANMTISLLSEPRLVSSTQLSTTCHGQYTRFVFKYNATHLLGCYAVCILFATFAVIVGFHSLLKNGVCYDTTFSRIIAASRNNSLDFLFMGSSLANDPFSRHILNKKIRFGVLERSLPPSCAFGSENETAPILEGIWYN